MKKMRPQLGVKIPLPDARAIKRKNMDRFHATHTQPHSPKATHYTQSKKLDRHMKYVKHSVVERPVKWDE